MSMKVSEVIRVMNSWFEPDDDIVINWFEKDDFSNVDGKPVSQDEWEYACYRAEDSEYLLDRDVVDICIRESRENESK
jgi:hypothetical protein